MRDNPQELGILVILKDDRSLPDCKTRISHESLVHPNSIMTEEHFHSQPIASPIGCFGRTKACQEYAPWPQPTRNPAQQPGMFVTRNMRN
jgi:hypothetical protein